MRKGSPHITQGGGRVRRGPRAPASISSARWVGRGIVTPDLGGGLLAPLEGLTLAWGLAPGSILCASQSCSGLAGGVGGGVAGMLGLQGAGLGSGQCGSETLEGG